MWLRGFQVWSLGFWGLRFGGVGGLEGLVSLAVLDSWARVQGFGFSSKP